MYPLLHSPPHRQLTIFLLMLSLLLAPRVYAGAAQWSATNFQYLYGTSYQSIFFNETTSQLDSTDETAAIITLEHGWKYGDNFFFVDIVNPDREGEYSPTGYYAEISPRLSFTRLAGKETGTGLIKDLLLTTTAELGQGFRNYLYGVAVDLNIPKTPVAQINWYIRNEIGPDTGTGQQITLVWLTPFNVGASAWTFEGFFDYAFDMDHKEDNIVAGPRLLIDLAKSWGAPGILQVGIEYQVWRNKFGLDGIDEDVPQAMIKWIW